jgi:hypothetical protein
MSDYYDVVLNNADPSNCVFVEVEDANKRSVNVPLIQWVTAEERGDVYPALRVNIAAHDKEVLDKAVERVLTRCKDEQHNVYGYGHREVIPPCPMCLPAIAAIRGEGESE